MRGTLKPRALRLLAEAIQQPFAPIGRVLWLERARGCVVGRVTDRGVFQV
jgi:hypothetical protein